MWNSFEAWLVVLKTAHRPIPEGKHRMAQV